jgi:histidinol phosphatase-like enzyme
MVVFDRNYLSYPGQVKLYSFAAESINKLWPADFKIIVMINQSDICRGIFTKKGFAASKRNFCL